MNAPFLTHPRKHLMRNWSAIGANFNEDHVTRAKYYSGECLDVDVVAHHNDGRFGKLLEALLY